MLDKKAQEQVQKMKAEGQPYAKEFDEKYSKMTPEEKAKIDAWGDELDELLGDDEE